MRIVNGTVFLAKDDEVGGPVHFEGCTIYCDLPGDATLQDCADYVGVRINSSRSSAFGCRLTTLSRYAESLAGEAIQRASKEPAPQSPGIISRFVSRAAAALGKKEQ
ncbi:hypothetical protein [Achromobacter sp.]|uniref:hypothetical protein n=1 Tax=Achromobacter sp. TaxID=134375 RepID=UPI000EB9A6FB|nr:hypothetical protein [Achromobacter sp.]HCW16917.1 hypothetical protein [Achromobacter sp.]